MHMRFKVSFLRIVATSILLTMIGSALNAGEKKKIVVFGSSVAAGWVTSYKERYDMQNGYAYRLQRAMSDYEVIVNSVPGDNTKSSLRRIQPDLIDLKPDYALIGLAMANEGLGRAPVDSVMAHYRQGLKKIIALCRENGIEPIVGLCYPNDSFGEEEYNAVRAMNIEVAQWDVPTINFLGALDDGKGKFPEGTTFEGDHPENLGHEEMFYVIEPGIFRASPAQNTAALNPRMGKDYRNNLKAFTYIPTSMMHSFTFTFDCMADKAVQKARIEGVEGTLMVRYDKDGLGIEWKGQKYDDVAQQNEAGPLRVTISQYYLDGRIEFYLNDQLVKTIEAQLQPQVFNLDTGSGAKYANAGIYRSAMNQDEIRVLCNGTVLNGSLCVWSNLELDKTRSKYDNAITWNEVGAGVKVPARMRNALFHQYREAREARENEPVFPEKPFITLSEDELTEFAGEYEITPDDHMELRVVDNELRLFDHGQSIGLRCESKDHFFVKAPYTFTVEFERTDGRISQMVVTVMGNQLKAKPVK